MARSRNFPVLRPFFHSDVLVMSSPSNRPQMQADNATAQPRAGGLACRCYATNSTLLKGRYGHYSLSMCRSGANGPRLSVKGDRLFRLSPSSKYRNNSMMIHKTCCVIAQTSLSYSHISLQLLLYLIYSELTALFQPFLFTGHHDLSVPHRGHVRNR